MSSRIAACLVSTCALWSLLVAGEARAFPDGNHRFDGRRSSHNQSGGLAPAIRRLAAWPPRSGNLRRPAAAARRAARSGRFGDAFMVDPGWSPVPVSGEQLSYGAASNGDGWRVLWSDDNDYSLRTSGVGSDGALYDPAGRLVDYQDYSPSPLTRAVVGTGSGFIAVWPGGDYGIWGGTLDSAGAPAGSFFVFGSDSGQAEPAVAFDGDSTGLVVWTESPDGDADIYAARVTTGGRVLDSVPIAVADDSFEAETGPCVAFGQGVYMVTWTAYDVGAVAKAVMVSRDGAVLDTAIFLRRDSEALQAYPTVAFGDSCFLAAWSEGLLQPDVYAARVSVSGALIDTAGVQLSSSPALDVQPSVGFDGTRYLVMWCQVDTLTGGLALSGRRMTADGVPLDSGLIRPELPGQVCLFPSAAADQAGFLVAFTAYDTLADDENVCCVRISPDGVVLDSGVFLPLGAGEQFDPSGASDGTDFLAAWFETQGQGHAVSAARIRADGTVLDTLGFLVNGSSGNRYYLSTAFGDSIYLVAWADYRSGVGADIYCARVGLDGRVLDPDGIVVCDSMWSQVVPDISFDGENFLVVWQDYRTQRFDNIYAARVSPAGVVLDPGGFAVAADASDDETPSTCFTGADHLVVWRGRTFSPAQLCIYGALVSPAGTITKPRFVVSYEWSEPLDPAVAYGPTSSLVTWADTDSFGGHDIYAARIRADGTVPDTNRLFVAGTSYDETEPRVTADEAGFRVLWRQRGFSDSITFVAARVDTSGNVRHVGEWFGLPSDEVAFDVAYGSGPDLLLLFSCLTDSAQGRYFGAERVWGRFGAVPGIEQAGSLPRSQRQGASVVRGILWLPTAIGHTPQAACLLDISGRKVKDLGAGANDVSGFAPGVYFVREPGEERTAPSITKVILTR